MTAYKSKLKIQLVHQKLIKRKAIWGIAFMFLKLLALHVKVLIKIKPSGQPSMSSFVTAHAYKIMIYLALIMKTSFTTDKLLSSTQSLRNLGCQKMTVKNSSLSENSLRGIVFISR